MKNYQELQVVVADSRGVTLGSRAKWRPSGYEFNHFNLLTMFLNGYAQKKNTHTHKMRVLSLEAIFEPKPNLLHQLRYLALVFPSMFRGALDADSVSCSKAILEF